MPKPEMDVARSIRVVEWLKAELAHGTGLALKSIVQGPVEMAEEALANVIITVYLLAKRLGLSFNRLDLRVESKIYQYIKDKHEVEKWYGDLSELLKYLTEKRGDPCRKNGLK